MAVLIDPARTAGRAAGAPNGAPSNRIWTADFLKISLANAASFTSFNLLLITLPLYIIAIGGSESDVGLVMGCSRLRPSWLGPLWVQPWTGSGARACWWLRLAA